MQVPYRKPGKFSLIAVDPLITKKKLLELQNKLDHLKSLRPQAAADVAQLAELGDFSENAEYQLAKGRLRGINNNIYKLEHQINQAEIIAPREKTDNVQIGSTVTVENEGIIHTYNILGSAETSPGKGVISYNSPLGSALIGCQAGDEVEILLINKKVIYKILAVK